MMIISSKSTALLIIFDVTELPFALKAITGTLKIRCYRLYRDGTIIRMLVGLGQDWHFDGHTSSSCPAFLKRNHVGCEQYK